jgi:predicted alpha-1,2-mannosidase
LGGLVNNYYTIFNKIISIFFITLVFSIIFLNGCSEKQAKSPIDYVDPIIGTADEGHTFPGACLPFGMVQLSPDNAFMGVKGYVYSNKSILGFSHTHLSGTGPGTKTHYNNILFMPTTGDLEILPGIIKARNIVTKKFQDKSHNQPPDDRVEFLWEESRKLLNDKEFKKSIKGYESAYSHSQEEASPGYYAVMLQDYGIKAELTATERVGFHRYSFPESRNAHIIIDVTHSFTPGRESYVKIVTDTQIQGYTIGAQEGSYDMPLKCYFFAEFSKPFASAGVWHGDKKEQNIKEASGSDGIGAYVNYTTTAGEQILVKVGISFVSIEGAKRNLETEAPHWDFNKVHKRARDIWNAKLNKIAVKGGSEEQKIIFYTAMYHSLLFPRTFSDVDGSYYSHFDHKVRRVENSRYYVDFSLWDTYRALHPLLAWLEPKRQNEMIKTFLTMYDQGGSIPLHVSYKNYYQALMIGDHATSIIVDSYMKGIRDFDIKKAYEAMRKNATVPGARPSSRYGLDYYMKLGYLPAEKVRESVSVTLEDAYDDACLAAMAKALGKEDDFKLFSQRARYYKNLYDKQSGFMRPRMEDGSWLKRCTELPHIVRTDVHPYYSCFDPLWVGVSPNRHFTESNAWQYLWYVPHDVQGLIDLMGGARNFTAKLDTLFTMTPYESGAVQYAPMHSKIGQYVHGNEPVHHVAYLYNYAGQPWKTQMRVNQIMNEMYGTGPNGLCGNDDMGQMSAWYIFSALGFYPVAPGQNIFVIGTPLFPEATIKFGTFYGQKEFTIKAKNISSENIYIQSALLNGKPFNKSWISHKEIISGGTLTFNMGNNPNKDWAISPGSVPPSMFYKENK